MPSIQDDKKLVFSIEGKLWLRAKHITVTNQRYRPWDYIISLNPVDLKIFYFLQDRVSDTWSSFSKDDCNANFRDQNSFVAIAAVIRAIALKYYALQLISDSRFVIDKESQGCLTFLYPKKNKFHEFFPKRLNEFENKVRAKSVGDIAENLMTEGENFFNIPITNPRNKKLAALELKLRGLGSKHDIELAIQNHPHLSVSSTVSYHK